MREIKFRAWDNFNKQMLYPEQHFKDDVMVIRCLSGMVGYEWDSEGGGGVEDNKYLIPLQFTGLKDKNGKEIYEGDILFDEINDEKLLVEWDKSGCWKIGRVWACNYSANGADEIIGNIYENPELLSG